MPYETRNPAGAKELLDGDQGWVYVDVRTVEEFDQGHVQGAYNIPVAFRGAGGMVPNEDFVRVVTQHFPRDTRLVFG